MLVPIGCLRMPLMKRKKTISFFIVQEMKRRKEVKEDKNHPKKKRNFKI